MVPGLLRVRMSGNEASAIGSLRAVNTAQQNYSQQCNGYAPLLTELKAAGNYLSPDMTSGATVAKSGYNITLAAGAGNAVLATQAPGCTASGTNYYGSAVPLTKGSTGTRAFATECRARPRRRPCRLRMPDCRRPVSTSRLTCSRSNEATWPKR